MPTDQRRAAARRRAWGRGPILLRFEPLESRELMATTAGTSAAATPLPDLRPAAFDTLHNLAWGDSFHARGRIANGELAPVTTPFQVAIYASPTPGPGTNAVLLGVATIPAGLQPGQLAPFDQTVTLPSTPLNGLDTSGLYYVGIKIDPAGTVTEASNASSTVSGQGLDLSAVTPVAHKSPLLVGTSLGVYPDQGQWGQPIQVTAQVQNAGPGDAPGDLRLGGAHPRGAKPGGASDFTVGSVGVPAIGSNQSAVVNQPITLPAAPPAVLAGSTQFTLWLVPDADYVTNAVFPHSANQGPGKDATQITIATAQDMSVANAPKPDLNAVSLQAPTLPLTFGQTFQVTASVHNNGKLDSGPFRVRFLLVGSDGSLNNTLFLADAQVGGVKAGSGQDIIQTLQLPTRLPDGMQLNTSATGKIAVIVDPEHTLDLTTRSDNVALSAPVTLRVIGTDGQVTQVATPTIPTPASTTAQTKATAGTSKTAGPIGKATSASTGKSKKPVVHANHTVQHNLSVFPRKALAFVKNGFKNK